jgi:hypothetical protein
MEPLDDEELSQLLRQWTAPPAPASLGRRIRSRRGPSWRWLLTGTIRIPVPVGIAAAVVLVALWVYASPSTRRAVPQPEPAPSVSLADFQPVVQLEPLIIGAQK